MRFPNSANGSNISDGPHRIDQTASMPGQIVLTVPAIDVARMIILEAQPLLPEAGPAGKTGDGHEPVIVPQSAAPRDRL